MLLFFAKNTNIGVVDLLLTDFRSSLHIRDICSSDMNLTIFRCSFCCDFTSHSFCHTEMFPCRLIHQGFLLNVMLKLLSLGCFLACISSLIAAPVLSLSRPLLAWAYCLSLPRIPVPTRLAPTQPPFLIQLLS